MAISTENYQITESEVAERRRCTAIRYRLETLLKFQPGTQWPSRDNLSMREVIQDIHTARPSLRTAEEVELDHWVKSAYQKKYTKDKTGYNCKTELAKILHRWESEKKKSSK